MKAIMNHLALLTVSAMLCFTAAQAAASELTVYTFVDTNNQKVRIHRPLAGVLVKLSGHAARTTNNKGEAIFSEVAPSRTGKGYKISLSRTDCGKKIHLYKMPNVDARVGIGMQCTKRVLLNTPPSPRIRDDKRRFER